MSAARRPSLFDRLYGLLLRVYPRKFRAKFEHEMRESVKADEAQAREAGVGATTRFYSRTAAEAVVYGLAERQRPFGAGPKPSPWTVDWRDAFRSLKATPLVTTVAVLSLALGIGANAALFSILNSLSLKLLPVRAPEELVVVADGSWTNPIWEDIRARHVFHEAFAWWTTTMNLSTAGETDNVPGDYASGEMFDVLGVHAILGRTFTPADDSRTGGADGPVVVISEGFWRRRFGGSPSAIGQRLSVNGLMYTVIGVTPKDFFGPDVGRTPEIFAPIGDRALEAGNTGMLDGRSNWWLEIMGRLAPGETIQEATDALRRLQPAIRQATMPTDWPERERTTFIAEPFGLTPAGNGESSLRGTYLQPLQIILAVVAAVLVIACANIANLLLARATSRQHELSLRLALGASRARVARQLLAESLILAGAGAAGGLVVANWCGRLLLHQLSGRGGAAVTLDLTPDWRVLGFTAGVAVVTALIFGLAPAVGVARLNAHEALKYQGRGVVGERRAGVRNILVVAQVALSLALVAGATLFLRTFLSLSTVSLGFNPDPMMAVNVNASKEPAAATPTRFASLVEAVQAVPGVSSAALSEISPASGSGWNTVIEPPPYGDRAVRQRLSWVNAISPNYFRTLGVRLLQGRDFDTHDGPGATPVLIVNETFAKRFLASRAVLGATVHAGLEGPSATAYTVVGLVSDSIYRSARAGFEAQVFCPLGQVRPPKALVLSVRAAGASPDGIASGLSQAIRASLPEASFTMRRVSDQVGATMAQERLLATLAALFGALALILAALGLYGVTAYAVDRRRGEIGIRMALGANRGGVQRLVVGRVIWLVAAGVAIGAGLSVWVSTFVAKLLFHVAPRDPLTLSVAAVVLCAAALAAAWIPARRAASIDPSSVLRES